MQFCCYSNIYRDYPLDHMGVYELLPCLAHDRNPVVAIYHEVKSAQFQ